MPWLTFLFLCVASRGKYEWTGPAAPLPLVIDVQLWHLPGTTGILSNLHEAHLALACCGLTQERPGRSPLPFNGSLLLQWLSGTQLMNYLDNKSGSYWVILFVEPTAYALSQFGHINIFCKMCMLGWPVIKRLMPIFNCI